MHENHAGSDERDLQHFACTKNSVAVRVSAKHAVQHSRGDGEIGRPKEYPSEANGGIRKTEIILQMKAKTESRANGAGGVAGVIEKYLAGECHNTEPGIECDERTGVTKDAIGRTRKHRVGQHDFLEQTEGHEQQ